MRTGVLQLFLCIACFASCQIDADRSTVETKDKYEEIRFNEVEDMVLASSVVSLELAQVLKQHTGENIEALLGGNEYGELDEVDSLGLRSRVDSKKKFEILAKVMHDVVDSSFSAVCYYDDEDIPYIAIVKVADDFELIRTRGTQAINYDMLSSDLITELEVWRKKYDFKIIGVANDFVDILFDSPPSQSKEFKEMVGELCPDALDWLNDEEYVLLMNNGSAYVNLWWD